MHNSGTTLKIATAQLASITRRPLTISLFAGGGGACVAIEQAFGHPVDIAINHDVNAISMHAVNHPATHHYLEDVFSVDPDDATNGHPVSLIHLSPDCTHFSQARGGQPRNRVIRSLSWVALKWIARTRPELVSYECVSQIRNWGPLIAKRDSQTGRVIKLDGSVASVGERVPVSQQFLIPCPKRRGQHWKRFIKSIRELGYTLDYQLLCASDYGAATSRTRLFMMASRDRHLIHWPEKTHGEGRQFRTACAADIIDWSIPTRSIFERDRALAEATHRRIVKGIQRHVLETADPFIVPLTHSGGDRVHSIREPVRTITGAHRGELSVCQPLLERLDSTCEGISNDRVWTAAHITKFRFDSHGSAITCPLPTITAGGAMRRDAGAAHALGLANACLMKAADIVDHTQSSTQSDHQRLLTANVSLFYGSNNTASAGDVRQPLSTVTASGQHHAVINCVLSKIVEEKALRVARFMTQYGWTPSHTLVTLDGEPLVVLMIGREWYVMVDIMLRMLAPAELYRAQGFPSTYSFVRGHDGRTFSKTAQVKLVGNSVSPQPLYAALVANIHTRDVYRNVA